MSAALLPEIVGEWTADMRGARDGLVIPGTAHDVTMLTPKKRRPWLDSEEDEDGHALIDAVLEELAELRAAVSAKQQQTTATYAAEVLQDEDRKNGHRAG